MIDTLQKVPIVRTYVDVIYLLASGYKIIGNFELGEYTSLIHSMMLRVIDLEQQ